MSPADFEGETEAHPAFGMASVHRVTAVTFRSGEPRGAVLFDSDMRHQHYMVLSVRRATRDRGLHRDWIHEDSRLPLIEIAMSEAQWAALVSSVNSSGVPVTIKHTEADGRMPDLDFDSRLELTHRETLGAADRAFAAIKEARDAYAEKKTAANLRALHYAIENAPANVEFAARSLTKHAETVVQKARADIEAMAMATAERHPSAIEAPTTPVLPSREDS